MLAACLLFAATPALAITPEVGKYRSDTTGSEFTIAKVSHSLGVAVMHDVALRFPNAKLPSVYTGNGYIEGKLIGQGAPNEKWYFTGSITQYKYMTLDCEFRKASTTASCTAQDTVAPLYRDHPITDFRLVS